MSATLLNGLPTSIQTLSATETTDLEALALSPANPVHGDGSTQILIGTPTLGIIHMRWHSAMQGMVVPPNWATVRSTPMGYTTADAQNMLVDATIKGPFKAPLLIEDDTCPPPQALLEFDRWLWKMERKLAPPVVSGIYHIKGSAEVRHGKTGGIEMMGPEPLAYRDGGSRAYRDWKYGDVIWVSGVPTGALLIHRSLLKAWTEEPDLERYTIGGYPTPFTRVFANPSKVWLDPSGVSRSSGGTSDLWWSAETIRRRLLAKAGWPKYAKKRYPFIIDTALRFGHVDRMTGEVF